MPKTIISVEQNETANINFTQTPNTDLLISGLSECCAVIIKDAKGNVSATHVDARTDLSFIKKEAANMFGTLTIDIIKNKKAISRLAEEKVLPYLNEHLPKVKNSKGNRDIRTTNTGTVLLRQDTITNTMKLLTPSFLHVEMIAPQNKDKRHLIPEDNPLREDILDEGAKPAQVRIYERFFMSIWHPEDIPPTVIFDNRWTDQFASLSTNVVEILNTLGKNKNSSEQLIHIITKTKLNPGTEKLIQNIVPSIAKYKALVQELENTSDIQKLHLPFFNHRADKEVIPRNKNTSLGEIRNSA
jgi:hypothetical protein